MRTEQLAISMHLMRCMQCKTQIRVGVVYYEGGPRRRMHLVCAKSDLGMALIEFMGVRDRANSYRYRRVFAPIPVAQATGAVKAQQPEPVDPRQELLFGGPQGGSVA